MPVYSGDLDTAPAEEGLSSLPTSLGASLGATAQRAFSEGWTPEVADISGMEAAKGHMPSLGDFEAPLMNVPDALVKSITDQPDIPIDAARQRVKESGLPITLPDTPTMKQGHLDLLLNRAREQRELEATIARGPSGFVPGALSVGTSFAVGAVDPVNAAAMFIPVVGEARYGKLLGTASETIMGRAAVRAAAGAETGAYLGAAKVPLDLLAAGEDGRDYGYVDALQSIIESAGTFGLMHGTFGLAGDVYSTLRGRPLEALGGEATQQSASPSPSSSPAKREEVSPPSLVEQAQVGPAFDQDAHAQWRDAQREQVANGTADAAASPSPAVESPSQPAPAPADPVLAPVLDRVRAMGSPMDVALRSAKEPEATWDAINDVIGEIRKAERALRERHNVKKTEDLEDAPLTKAEKEFLFYGSDHTDTEFWTDLRKQLQPVESLDEAAQEIAHEMKRLPADTSKLSTTDELTLARLQVLFSEVARHGGDLPTVLRDAAKKYGSRFSDPEDAIFMVQNAAERMRSFLAPKQEAASADPLTDSIGELFRTVDAKPALTAIESLSPQAKSDLMHGTVAALTQGKAAPAMEMLRAGAGTDARIAQVVHEIGDAAAGVTSPDQAWHALANTKPPEAEPDSIAAFRAAENLQPPASVEASSEPEDELAPLRPPARPGAERAATAPKRTARRMDETKMSLVQFLAARGGLQETPDLRAIFDGNPFVPGFGRLFRTTGMTTDQAWETALEGKYLFEPSHEPGVDRPVETGWRDVAALLEKEARGEKQYRAGYEPPTRGQDPGERLHQIEGAIDDAFARDGLPPPSGSLRDRVIEILDKEGISDPLDAFEQAVMEAHYAGTEEGKEKPGIPDVLPGWNVPHDAGAAQGRGEGSAAPEGRPEGAGPGEGARAAGGRDTEAPRRTSPATRAALEAERRSAADFELQAGSLTDAERAHIDDVLRQIDLEETDWRSLVDAGAACLASAAGV
jgi:hypothetical protein